MVISGGIFFIFRTRIIAHFIPNVEQIGDIHIQIKNDTAYVSSKLIVKNKSFIKIEIDTVNYKIELFNKTYLQDKKFVGVVLQGHGKDTLDFSLKIPYTSILKQLKTQRSKGDSLDYSITISLQYYTVFGKVKIPIHKSAKLKIPEPPQLEVIEIKYKKVRIKSILADAKIKIINHSAISLLMKEMNFSMNVLKKGNIKGSFKKDVTIKPNGATFINLPIKIHVNNLGKTIFEILINKDTYDYTLTLNAILESPDSLKQSFHLDITKSGKIELKK